MQCYEMKSSDHLALWIDFTSIIINRSGEQPCLIAGLRAENIPFDLVDCQYVFDDLGGTSVIVGNETCIDLILDEPNAAWIQGFWKGLLIRPSVRY